MDNCISFKVDAKISIILKFNLQTLKLNSLKLRIMQHGNRKTRTPFEQSL